eukprot:scaffold63173_cov18-Tisochrysis_lutea.AAC.1
MEVCPSMNKISGMGCKGRPSVKAITARLEEGLLNVTRLGTAKRDSHFEEKPKALRAAMCSCTCLGGQLR